MPRQLTLQSGPMLAPRPPLAAYREDLARRGDNGPFGPSDATWLAVATVLSHLVDVPPEGRPPLLAAVRDVLAGDASLGATVDAAAGEQPRAEHELDAVGPVVRAVVEVMEDGGALRLAYSTLSILADADLRSSILERGRVHAHLGRVAWKAGALDTSRDQYRRVEVLGRAARSAELRVRAWVGYSVIARLRGNYPEVREWATRAAHEADRAGLRALASLAYHSLMVSAGVAGDFNGSLIYGWKAFDRAADDRMREAEMLLNLSQLLLVCGQPAAAANGYMVVLSQMPPARLALPTLSGLARAAAAQGQPSGVYAARDRIEHLVRGAGLPYQAADALLELSEALSAVGDATAAAECSARALDIAGRHGYHEITHRLQELERAPAPRRADAPHALDPQGEAVARAVASLGVIFSGATTG